MDEETETQQEIAPPKFVGKPKVALKRNSKGVFWEVVAYDDDIDEAKRETIRVDGELLKQYAEVNA